MSTEHTPGPWATDGTEVFYEDDDVRPCVAFINHENTSDAQAAADARLIAAAPDLLAALHKVQDWLEGCSTRQTMQAQVARAIALATGEDTTA
jgi:hypothetical protein